MVDEIDRTAENIELETQASIRQAAAAAAKIPKGRPGECRECRAFSQRLVGGRCAPCRDGI